VRVPWTGGGVGVRSTTYVVARLVGAFVNTISIGAFVNKTKHKKLINNYRMEFKLKVL
jgi:hypothetical protein